MPRGGEPDARAFYVELVGLTEVAKPDALAGRGGVWFRSEALELHPGVEEPFSPARKAHSGIAVADASIFEALANRLVAAGHEVRPDALFPGHRRFYVDDCFGNRLEFLVRR
ncbi:VOC family protein [soil metagenome]